MVESWAKIIDAYKAESEEYKNIILAVQADMKKSKVYPSPDKIFRAFSNLEYDEVNVLLLGQDPYPNGEANGLAFATDGSITPSLRMIFTELEAPTNPSLMHWEDQGVLLLNSALTVKKKQPGSHRDLWKPFIKHIISELKKKDVPIVFGCLGSVADKLVGNTGIHRKVSAPHPAADTYSGERKFRGSGFFKNINKELVEIGKPKIIW